MAKTVPKFGAKEIINFIGMRDLEPEEQYLVNRLSTGNYQKIKRVLKNITNMTVHIKCYEKTGGKKKFSLHVRVSAPTTKVIESCRSHDFDLARALHKAFDDVRTQINHKYRSDTTRPKAYE